MADAESDGDWSELALFLATAAAMVILAPVDVAKALLTTIIPEERATVVAAPGEAAGVFAVCLDGQFGLLVARDPDEKAHEDGWAAEDRYATIGLRLHPTERWVENVWPNLAESKDVWSIPNGRTAITDWRNRGRSRGLTAAFRLPGDGRPNGDHDYERHVRLGPRFLTDGADLATAC